MQKYLNFIFFTLIFFHSIFSIAYGEKNYKKIQIYNKQSVTLKNFIYYLSYKQAQGKHSNTFITIRNCNEVVIDGITIIQQNSNYFAYHSILIEDCKKVTIRNSEFKGTCLYHLRIEGCDEVLIENVKITGYDYGKKGVRCGGGIWINNGESRPNGGNGLWSPNPGNMKTLFIRNCEIKNNITADKSRNQDGILIHSASNGKLSNCIFENWLAGDAALDISHRRIDETYTEKHFKIERCVFINNKHVKSTGTSNKSNSILWVNNIYIDTKIGSYHKYWSDKRFYESYMFNGQTFGFWRNWSTLYGLVQIRGGLLHVKNGTISEMYKLSAKASVNAFKFIQPDYNIYSMQREPNCWLAKQISSTKKTIHQFPNWLSWCSSGRDVNSKLLIHSEDVIVMTKNGLKYPVYIASHKTSIPNINDNITEDFFGNPRDKFCYGAVCPESNNNM